MKAQFQSSGDAWFVYYGLDPNNDNKPAHVDRYGKLVPNEPSEKPTDALCHEFPAEPIEFPMLNAGRLYVSRGGPLLFTVDAAGNPIPPRPADASDPNYKTPWDFYEVTYIPLGDDGLFNFNVSNVQSANLPLTFHVLGSDPSTKKPVDYTRGCKAAGYKEFLAEMQDNKDYKDLVLPQSDRVLAPGTAIMAFEQKVIPAPLFPSDYFADYVEKVWAKFAEEDLTFIGDPPPESNKFVTWTGRVANGQFTFTTEREGLEPIVLNPPATADLFENNFNFCASGGGTPGSLQQNYALQLFGTLCAAFNRSVMLTTTTLANSSDCAWCKASEKFYQDETTNYYAKFVHSNAIDGLAYAFQSDDHCDVSSYVSVLNPTELTLTLES